MRRWSLILGLVAIVTFLSVLIRPAVVLAHERRTIAGKYDVEVGWDKEPALVGQLNGALINITKTGTEDGIEGVDRTLKVQIAYGGNAPKEFALHSVEGRKGYYVADILPTRTGSYIFTFVGQIEDTQVNEKFESGPGRFDDVDSLDSVSFPAASSDSAPTSSDVKAARDAADSARTLAIVGIVVGILGLFVGIAALVSRRRA